MKKFSIFLLTLLVGAGSYAAEQRWNIPSTTSIGDDQRDINRMARDNFDELYGVTGANTVLTTAQPINMKVGYNAVGNDVADDTAALAAGVAACVSSGRPCYLPAGVYRTTAPLQLTTRVYLYGDGVKTVIKGMSVTGGIIQIGDGTTDTRRVIVRDLEVGGTGTQGVKVNNAQNITLDGIGITDVGAASVTDGFWFDQTWASSFKRLWTNGSTISGAAFKIGGAYNANYAEQWYTSNTSTYSFYFQNDFGSSLTSRGNTFNNLTAQGAITGLYMGNGYQANIINGYYSENVVHAVVLGDKANNKLVTALTMNGAQLGAPSNTHAHYSERDALINVNYARGVTFNSPNLDGSFNIKTFAPLTFGGGGTGARGYAIVNPSGGVSSILLIYGGTGYTSPTVTIGGTCSGSTATAAGSGAITSITLTAAGTGCGNAPPVPIIYKDALKIVISRPYFNTGNGVNSPVWPWIARTSDATSSSGISMEGDLAEDTGANLNSQAQLQKVDAFSYKHYEFYRNSSGVEQAVAFTPAAFP